MEKKKIFDRIENTKDEPKKQLECLYKILNQDLI